MSRTPRPELARRVDAQDWERVAAELDAVGFARLPRLLGAAECRALAGLWRLPEARLLASPYVLAEARRNVADPQTVERLEALIDELMVLPSEPAGFEIADDPCLPPKDRPVLLAAIAAGASHLLTGDLTHFRDCFGREVAGVRVMLPGEYLRGGDG